jgi:putative ABC transport system permease protein
MKSIFLIRKSIRFYFTYYRLIALATLITVAVITGSLLVGESVRSTLVKRVSERLGDTETILFDKYGFFESAVAHHPLFEGKAKAILISVGFISDAGRLLPVQVWGVDDRDIPAGGIKVNRILNAELALPDGGDVVLRLPATGLIPSGSMFVTGNYTTEARLKRCGIITSGNGGNLNLKNEQTIPYNVFINREELASLLKVEGKSNLILSAKHVSVDAVNAIWSPSISGIQISPILLPYPPSLEITSDRIFIQEEVVQTLCHNNPDANRIFSYLVNSMQTTHSLIPYSFVTAMDAYKGKALADDAILLSDYAAQRLNVALNDSIFLTYYYTTDNLKTLHVDTLWGRVAGIVPITELVADAGLSADFPGLSDVERCTDWDSDLPVDMKLITAEDEDYWTQYHTTPKAIISYNAIRQRWNNAYGSATALRFPNIPNTDGLNASMFGLQVIYPREAGFEAARKGVDFASLFLSLGIFIIISALLLLLVPLSEMIYRRRDEITLLHALGYSQKRITCLLWSESFPIVIIASLGGIAAGIIYTQLVLLLLGTLWKGATQTSGFILHPDIVTICIGWIIGVALALITVPLGIRRILSFPRPSLHSSRSCVLPFTRSPLLPSVVLLILVLWMGINFKSVVCFMIAGILLIATLAFAGDYWIISHGTSRKAPFNEDKLLWSSLLANRKRVRLSFWTLATGIFLVFSVGLNRQGFSDGTQLASGTGGYALWCETTVPVYHNLSTSEGRNKLALNDLPTTIETLQITRYSADDAGCLNLNRVSQPSVLGVDMQAIRDSKFHIRETIWSATTNVFEALQRTSNSVYPVLIDETVLRWSLMRQLGDTIRYDIGDRTVSLQIVGTIDNSIFQGNMLMDKNLFAEIWSKAAGSEIILFKVNKQETTAVKRLIEQALHEYGVRVTTTVERLQQFNSVTDTYLTIFLTLGGLGLLLGIISFIVVIRKDLASRKEQIQLYLDIGFSPRRIAHLLITECRIVPLYAIVSGVSGALVGTSAGFTHIGVGIALLSLVLASGFIACIIIFIHQSVYKYLPQK